ncbi:MAG: ABC transporter permease [Balneolaceae bacterium]
MFKNYVKIAFRNLTRNKGFSVINITGLAVALAVFLIIMLFIRHETSFNRFFTDSENIYRVILIDDFPEEPKINTQLPEPIVNELQELYPEVEQMAKVSSWPVAGEVLLSSGEHELYSDKVLQGSLGLFQMFDFPFLAGDSRRALDEPNSAVVTETTARNLFGSLDVLGETVVLNNESEMTITGIVEDMPTNSSIRFDLISHRQDMDFSGWNMHLAQGFLKLSNAEAVHSLNEKLPAYVEEYAQIQPGAAVDYRISLQPIADAHLYPEGREAGNSRVIYIRILFVVALLILLVACINYINLATSASAGRSREVGVRKTVGASRGQVMTQITVESIITCSIAFFIAFLLAELMISYVYRFFDIELLSLFSISAGWFGILIATLGSVGIASGAYAAVWLSSFRPAEVLRSGGLNAGYSSGTLRRTLVVSQFAISIAIVMAALLISQQMEYIQSERLNGNDASVISIKNNSPEIDNRYEAFKQELLRHPDVVSVSGGTVPNRIGMTSGYRLPDDDMATVHIFGVEFDYLETLGLELIAGRDFDPERSEDTSGSVIINETAARVFGVDESLDGNEAEIDVPFSQGVPIGIVRDFHTRTLFDPTEPVMIRIRDSRMGRGQILVRFQEGGIASGLEHVREVWAQFETAFPIHYNFLDEILDRDYRAEIRMAKLFGAFSGFSIFIACLGLFGLSAYTSQQRSKEIGIRKVMGATLAHIVILLNKDFLKLVVIGFVIAVPVAWYVMNRWLEDFAYRIDIGPGVFLLAGSVAVLIAFATVSWQSVRAALANPVDALRSE